LRENSQPSKQIDGYFEPWQHTFPPQIIQGLLTRIIHQPEKSIKASTFDVRVAPSPAASQAHHEPKSSP
jgi:hypothetical protein